jgi:hypothetical protein
MSDKLRHRANFADRETMDSTIIYCTHPDCGAGYGPAGELPIICPACQRTTAWTTRAPGDQPAVPYVITNADIRFLKSMRILPTK